MILGNYICWSVTSLKPPTVNLLLHEGHVGPYTTKELGELAREIINLQQQLQLFEKDT